MPIPAEVARPTLRYFPGVIANLLDGPDVIKTISLIAFSTILSSFCVSSYIFNVYAQTQSGPVTSGFSYKRRSLSNTRVALMDKAGN